MIFITVGTQSGFDRLVKVIDDWAMEKDIECFAQIGDGVYLPKNVKFEKYLTEQQFDLYFNKADIVISHAGMGTIISCLQKGKVLLTLPRDSKKGEHRNDHQKATTEIFSKKGYIYPIWTAEDLVSYLEKIENLQCLTKIGKYADDSLLLFLKGLLENE